MNPIALLLKKLSERVASYEQEDNSFEERSNNILLIQNIFSGHSMHIEDLNSETIFNLTKDEIKEIISIMEPDNYEEIFSSFNDVYFGIIEDYNDTKTRFGIELQDEPQVVKAKNKIDELCQNIIEFVDDFENNKEDFKNAHKAAMDLPKKYSECFKGEESISPINKLKEFNDLLDTLDLSLEEKGEIKLIVGKGNLVLIDPKTFIKPITDKRIIPFEVILKNKKAKYASIYEKMKDVEVFLVNAEDTVNKYSKDLNLPYNDVKQVVACLLLESYIKQYNETLNDSDVNEGFKIQYLDSLYKDLENVRDFSQKVEEEKPEVVTPEKEATTEETKELTDEDKLINQVNDILTQESDFINSVSKEQLRYYIINFSSLDLEDQNKCNLISILLTLKEELIYLNRAILDKDDHTIELSKGKIRKQLGLYYVTRGKTYEKVDDSKKPDEKPKDQPKKEDTKVSEQSNTENSNKRFKILYLTNSSNEPVIMSEFNKQDKNMLKKLNKILTESMPEGHFGKIKKLVIPGVSSVYYTYYSPIRIGYITLPNNALLITSVVFNDGDIKLKTLLAVSQATALINDYIEKAKDKVNLGMLWNEQADARAKLSNCFSTGKQK